MKLPPTSSPPKTNDDRIVHSGFSPPNSAATMPLNPAEPVKPVRGAVGDHPVRGAPEHEDRPGQAAAIAPANVIASDDRPLDRHPRVARRLPRQPDGPQPEPQARRHSRTYAATAASTAISDAEVQLRAVDQDRQVGVRRQPLRLGDAGEKPENRLVDQRAGQQVVHDLDRDDVQHDRARGSR